VVAAAAPGGHLQYQAVPREKVFVFQYIIKSTFSKRHEILKQVAMGSPLYPAN